MSISKILSYFRSYGHQIIVSDIALNFRLRKNKTANEIIKLLPLKSSINTWGDEIYFEIPKINVNTEDNAKDIVKLGEIAFWIEGNSIAIGFGRTPISKLNEIRLAAIVNIWADAEYPEQLKLLTKISDGHEISITIK